MKCDGWYGCLRQERDGDRDRGAIPKSIQLLAGKRGLFDPKNDVLRLENAYFWRHNL
jgi:hypothetical protein